jgi:NAD(P)-dependent dehydrogenase (short-subunit alcohol dehydrogenase family)
VPCHRSITSRRLPSLAQEVAGFGIATTLVEPGGFRTDASTRSAEPAPVLAAYDELREEVMKDFFPPRGEPAELARAVIAAADREQPPRRLLVGSDAYAAIQASLAARLAEAEAQRESAAAADPA